MRWKGSARNWICSWFVSIHEPCVHEGGMKYEYVAADQQRKADIVGGIGALEVVSVCTARER